MPGPRCASGYKKINASLDEVCLATNLKLLEDLGSLAARFFYEAGYKDTTRKIWLKAYQGCFQEQ
jgi:hypothetical protein